jgi:hypothetical protein
MEKLISCCGLNCAACEARIATLNNDDKLREETAEKWRNQYGNADITAEMINCTGCRAEGVKIGHWSECQIRLCAEARGLSHCGKCSEVENCDTIGFVHKHVPDALDNLKSLN